MCGKLIIILEMLCGEPIANIVKPRAKTSPRAQTAINQLSHSLYHLLETMCAIFTSVTLHNLLIVTYEVGMKNVLTLCRVEGEAGGRLEKDMRKMGI